MQRKLKYKLIKDTPTRKAGTIFTLSADNRYINLSDGTNCNEIYCRSEVEDNTEWFEPIFEEVDELSNTDRGKGGFGSTGVK